MQATIGTPVSLQNVTLGAQVTRGPHWEWDDDDGGPGCTGTILAVVDGKAAADKKYAKVKWKSTGKTGLYRLGSDGFNDLRYCEAIISPALVGCPVEAGSAIIGARISRSEAFDWGDQDSAGGGRIVGADAESGWVRVAFADGSQHAYRAGAEGKFDLVYGTTDLSSSLSSSMMMGSTSSATTAALGGISGSAAPRVLVDPSSLGGQVVTPQNFKPGARVVPNRINGNWRWDPQETENGGWAVLQLIGSDKWARVKWASGLKRSYRVGADGAYDLKYDEGNPMLPRIKKTPTAAPVSTAVAGRNGNGNNNNDDDDDTAPFTLAPSPNKPPMQQAKETLCAEFPAIEGIVIESILYQLGDDILRSREVLVLMAKEAEAQERERRRKEEMQRMKEQGIPSIDDLLEDAPGATTATAAATATTATPARLAPPPPKEKIVVKLAEREMQDGEQCIFCLTEPRTFALVPCGHLCLCSACVEDFKAKQNKCPQCRSEFQMVLKIFC